SSAVCRVGWRLPLCVLFFFQAEDGIRDFHVTGVQTCALPICRPTGKVGPPAFGRVLSLFERPTLSEQKASTRALVADFLSRGVKIGRASCREREEGAVGTREGSEKRSAAG